MNVGGGCGAPDCDYQVGCSNCMSASWAQYRAWLDRHGVSVDIRGTAERLILIDWTEALKRNG